MHPTSVAGYRIVEKVGRGGMGVVYRARDCLLERDVALKYLPAPDPERVERLIREARVASSLQHPGIVTIYGFVAEGPCIAMEYIHGSTLSSRLAAGDIPRGRAVRLGLDLAEALYYAHRSGVVHADLKPANIMIDSRGRAKILDFGLARWQQADALQTLSRSDDQLYKLAGTIPYMSPELLMGRPADSRSDIFSLGCVLFELFTGRRPFSRETPAATLNAILNCPPAGVDILRARLPEGLSGLVLKMLEKDPGRRPETLGDVAALLRGFCRDGEHKPAPAVMIFNRPPLRRWSVLLVALSLGTLFYLFSEPGVSSRQLRVFVAQPEFHQQEEEGAMNAVVWTSVINGLHLLGSVQAVVYHDPPVDSSASVQQAKLVGADEWIHIEFQPGNPLGNVQIQRIKTASGSVVEQINFFVPKRNAGQVANAVISQVMSIYDDIESSHYLDYLSISEESYAQFVEVYSSLNQGVGHRKVHFESLSELVEENSRFIAAQVLTVDLAIALFTDTDNYFYLERARDILNDLSRYHPNPIVVLQREAALEIESGYMERADRIVSKLEDLSPASADAMLIRSYFAERRGDLDMAVELISRASDVMPLSWRVRYRAAVLAIRNGDIDKAKDNILEMLEITPGNTIALGKLGLVELLYGDVDKSVEVYKKLLEKKKHRSYLVNIGLAYMLKGDMEEAKSSFLKALDVSSGNLVVMLNLADVELSLGNKERASSLYREILEKNNNDGYRSASDKMLEAQCLAHLGESDVAVERVLEALVQSPKDPEIAYQAALVYALVGEDKSALVNARSALRGGMDNRWFSLPVFETTSLPFLLKEQGLL